MQYKQVITVAQNLNREICHLGISHPNSAQSCSAYDEMVTNKMLRRKTERLFKEGHHARAVEEAYKYLDNLVKKKANLLHTELTGSKLMNTVFSLNNPLLKLNECVSSSEKNEQCGYMQILSGCMTGIRNPRAHDSDWEDTEQHALQLLIFANHLIERVSMAEQTENT